MQLGIFIPRHWSCSPGRRERRWQALLGREEALGVLGEAEFLEGGHYGLAGAGTIIRR